MRVMGVLFAMIAVTVADGKAWSISAQDGSRWRLGSAETSVSWSSGKDNDLSEWKTVDCVSEYGPRFLLTGLIGFREPSSNLDNFVARLKATCTELDGKSTHTASVFTSANHRDTAYELDALDWRARSEFICPGYFDAGPKGMIGTVTIGTNRGNDHVKNVRFFLRCARLFGDSFISWTTVGDTNQMIGERGYEMFDRVQLSCPSDDRVVTGIQLRFELGRGKIRDLRLFCRQLIYAP